MKKFRSLLRGAALVGVGATLLLMEKGDQLARTLAAKGKAAMAKAQPEAPLPDISDLTPEQRAQLRQQLDAAEQRANGNG